ncbi:MAG: hypothetical protein EKK57_02705 [Proteobacteria bacterium]|nr:MAG: hypothetical protein EKK57_02705 [Pseudomonadota bacterium]
MKYYIRFATSETFIRQTPKQIANLMQKRSTMNATIEECIMGSNTFKLVFHIANQVSVFKKIRGNPVESLVAVVNGSTATFVAMSPTDLQLVTALLTHYINTMETA